MRLSIKTIVSAGIPQIKEGFTADLFLKLNPPFPPVKLLTFDGCKRGDIVHLRLNFILFKQEWVSEITDEGETPDEWYFVDEGTTLPFFLKKWRHHHRICKVSESQSAIIDDFTYSTGTLLSDILLYPALFIQFIYRRPIYKRIFRLHQGTKA